MPVPIFGAEKGVGMSLIRTMRLVETDVRDGICVWFLGGLVAADAAIKKSVSLIMIKLDGFYRR
jgi:hypothetical protein